MQMKKQILLLAGSPGVGKTTVLLNVVKALKMKGYSVGGVMCREVCSCEERVGFEISDLSSGRRGWLAHINQKTGPQVYKYRINLEDINRVAVEAILKAAESSDALVIDEIDTMELFSEKFREAIAKTVEVGKLLVGVVHWKTSDGHLVEEVKIREDVEVFVVTNENREKLHETIMERAAEFLGSDK
jgi:nucleoside-triphosphatase